MHKPNRAALKVALAGIFCSAGCTTPASRPVVPTGATALQVSESPAENIAAARGGESGHTVAAEIPAPAVLVPERETIVTLQPIAEPRYAPPESLKQFRFPQKNQPAAVVARAAPQRAAPTVAPVAVAPPRVNEVTPLPAVDPVVPIEAVSAPVATVDASGEAPRYRLPDSLKDWRPGRKVPLYEDPEAAPWQASPTEARLRNAAVSCHYKDEGGVRGKVALLIDDFKVTRFTARIEMPNGGVCQFDAKKMAQRPFEQGIALQSTGDECVVRMWEQKHRITIAAYSCHKQCSKGSFSYLWPILMDTRIGTCY